MVKSNIQNKQIKCINCHPCLSEAKENNNKTLLFHSRDEIWTSPTINMNNGHKTTTVVFHWIFKKVMNGHITSVIWTLLIKGIQLDTCYW